ncbi:MAG: hypothetical protein COB09_06445 [Thalassobium sp.]|nr:MAG: hypothetical protein COB09_06445 [Thalassobium sp.]
MRRQALIVSSFAVLPLLLSAATFVNAEEAANAESAEAAPEFPIWGGSAELGTIRTSGNTDTSSINGKFAVKRDGETWDSSFKLDALTSKEDGVTSKEKYRGTIQFDRNFSEHSYLAIVGDEERARFSGFEYQATLSAGYGYRAIHEKNMELDFEAGPGYRRDKLKESGDIDEEAIARLVARYHWTIQKGVEFIEEFSAELGESNSIYKSETGLKSQINGSLATKLTYKVKYVDKVPADSENTDTEFGVTLVYSF